MIGAATNSPPSGVQLGLRENWRQFSLLILINAFVGGMVGLERTVVPLIGSEEFRIASTTIVVSFIVSFGVVKALRQSGFRAFRRRLWPQGDAGRRLAGRAPGPVHDRLGAELGLDRGRQRASRRQPGVRLVDDGDHEGRPRRPEVARPRRRLERIRRLSVRGPDRIPHRLYRAALWPAPGAVLPRHRLRRSRARAVHPARRRHAPSCPPRTLPSRNRRGAGSVLGDLSPHVVRRPQSVRRVTSRTRQQPQRRDELGHLARCSSRPTD